jgi:hypothetical protein
MGRGLYAAEQQDEEDANTVIRRRRGQAMEVVTELLKWHVARGDGLFEGITDLHLACLMGSEEEMLRLLDQGMDGMAKGHWPGLEHRVTPAELLRHALEADVDVAFDFPIPGLKNEMPRSEAEQLLGGDLPFLPIFPRDDESSVITEDLEF